MQPKLDREFQQMKIGDTRIEMEAERHTAQMNRMSQTSSTMMDLTGGSSADSLGEKIKNTTTHAIVFHAANTAINEAQQMLKVGLVDIESNMAGWSGRA